MVKIHVMRWRSGTTCWGLLGSALLAVLAGCSGLAQKPAPPVWPAPGPLTSSRPAPAAGTVSTPAGSVPVSEPTSVPATASPNSVKATVRGQDNWAGDDLAAGPGDHFRHPMPASQAPASDTLTTTVSRTAYQSPAAAPGTPAGYLPAAPSSNATKATVSDDGQWLTSPYLNQAGQGALPPPVELPGTPVPLDVIVQEDRTGRFMFGAGINSDAGVTGQVTVDERNFNLFGIPTSWAEVWNGEAFRGAGQAFRLEAIPGNRVQRYVVSFTEPYLLASQVSLNVSGFLYDRGFYDWNEARLGGRVGLGYRLTPDLSASAALRLEEVKITDPRVLGVAQLDNVLGSNDFYSGRFSLRHDTRDLPFAPTEGHLIELSYEQAFGQFDYPRGEIDYRKYFLVRERPDGSGRHTLSASLGTGFSGPDTPLFENYFAGGFSTLRGFDFRGASPVVNTVIVGGRFQLLGSVEYSMPLTADDMIKAVAFCDFGTVEEDIRIDAENFRVAPGFGFRISVPALGPAPLAFDFAFPVAKADTDDTQVFSFFFGIGRG